MCYKNWYEQKCFKRAHHKNYKRRKYSIHGIFYSFLFFFKLNQSALYIILLKIDRKILCSLIEVCVSNIKGEDSINYKMIAIRHNSNYKWTYDSFLCYLQLLNNHKIAKSKIFHVHVKFKKHSFVNLQLFYCH